MYLRNPKALEQTANVYEQIRAAFLANENEMPDCFELGGKEYELDTSSWPDYRDASAEDIKRMWLDSLDRAVWLAELFQRPERP